MRPDRNGVQFSPPKTRYGKRTISLGTKTIAVLRTHYEYQHNMQSDAGQKWQEYGLIFTTAVGTPIHPRNLLKEFKKVLTNAGLPEIRFHDLRHTAASLLLNKNIAAIVVSRRLGHASVYNP